MTAKVERVSDMADAALRCREKGHHWTFVTDKILASSRGVPTLITRFWKCPTCTTTMTEEIEIPSFEIRRRKYDYPDDYLLVGGMTDGAKVRVTDIRRESAIRSGIIKRPR